MQSLKILPGVKVEVNDLNKIIKESKLYSFD